MIRLLLPLLFFPLFFACEPTETIELQPFEIVDQYLEFSTTDDRTFRLTELQNNINWSILYFSEFELHNAFINRWSTEPRMKADLLFRLADFGPEIFDEAGKASFDDLAFPYEIEGSFAGYYYDETGRQVDYNDRRVTITFDAFENQILTGTFERDPADANPQPGLADITGGAFRVFFQFVKIE